MFTKILSSVHVIGNTRINTSSSVDALKRQFLHQQVHALIHFEAVQVVRVAQQPHQQTAERHVGGAKT